MGLMREAPAPTLEEWHITEAIKPELFDPNTLDIVIEKINSDFDNNGVAKAALVEYAESYYSQFEGNFNQERLVNAFDIIEELSRNDGEVRKAMFEIENSGINHKADIDRLKQAA
jgi:hypothetical protein